MPTYLTLLAPFLATLFISCWSESGFSIDTKLLWCRRIFLQSKFSCRCVLVMDGEAVAAGSDTKIGLMCKGLNKRDTEEEMREVSVAPSDWAKLEVSRMVNAAYSSATDFSVYRLPTASRIDQIHICQDRPWSSSMPRHILRDFELGFFRNFSEVKLLNLTQNGILTIKPSTNSSLHYQGKVVEIDLGFNLLEKLPGAPFVSFPNLQRLNLAGNRIHQLPDDFFQDLPNLKWLNLQRNPLDCDQMNWIREHSNDGKMEILLPPCEANVADIADQVLKQCPVECNCTTKDTDCSGRGLTQLPYNIPTKTKKLHLENNSITSITAENVSPAYNGLLYLYLDNNAIETLDDLEASSFIKNLVSLSLTGNRLTQLPIYIFNQLLSVNLLDLRLGNNPWSCECKIVSPFRQLLIQHFNNIKDLEQINCAADDPKHPGKMIRKLTHLDICYEPESHVHFLDVLNIIMGLLIVMIVAKVTHDYRRLKRTGVLPAGPSMCALVSSYCCARKKTQEESDRKACEPLYE